MKRWLNFGRLNSIIQRLFESMSGNIMRKTYLFFRAADLLLAGAVMNQEFQPHEAHVPFNLQVDTFSSYAENLLIFISFLLIIICMG